MNRTLGINELLNAILSGLTKVDLKSARRVSTSWASVGVQMLIGTLYISPREIDVAAFDGITQQPDLSKSVKHLVYDSAQFYGFGSAANYYGQIRVTHDRGAYMHMGNAHAAIQGLKELIYPEGDTESFVRDVLLPIEPPQNLARFKENICHKSFLEGFLRYSQHFQERGNILQSSWFTRVVSGLKLIGRIDSVSMANTWNYVYQRDEVETVYEEEMLHPNTNFCTGDYRRLRSCTVPTNLDDPDMGRLVNAGRIDADGRRLMRDTPGCDCLSASSDARGAAGLLGCGMSDGHWELEKLVDALLAAGQKPSKIDLTCDIERFTGIPASMFKTGGCFDKESFLEGLAKNLTTLNLDLVSFASRDELEKELRLLVRLLESAKRLEELALELPHDVPPHYENYRLSVLFKPIESWIRPALTQLALMHLSTGYNDLSRLLYVNLPNLKHLYLREISLDDGKWEDVVEGLRQIVSLTICMFDGPFWHPGRGVRSIRYSLNNTKETALEFEEFFDANCRYIMEGGTHPQSETYVLSDGLVEDIDHWKKLRGETQRAASY
ncbi:MAG: hypothetical protein Q9169_006673 [Polycauliona sp. 2 TL-2023]